MINRRPKQKAQLFQWNSSNTNEMRRRKNDRKPFFKSSHVASINKPARSPFVPTYSCAEPRRIHANRRPSVLTTRSRCEQEFVTALDFWQFIAICSAQKARRIVASTHTTEAAFIWIHVEATGGEESLLMAGWTWIETNSHIKLTEKSRWKNVRRKNQ